MTGRILVAGGNGRLGQSVMAALGQRGVKGVRAPHLSDDAILIDSAGKVDSARLSGIDAIINCTNCAVGPRETIRQANIDYAIALANRARSAGVRRFVQVSSFSVYGQAARIDSDTPLAPVSDYGRSKLAAEQTLAELATSEFHVASLRLPFMFSADQPALLGKLVATAQRFGLLPVLRGQPSRRSMITYQDAARILVEMAIALDPVSGASAAADPQPLELTDIASAIRNRLGQAITILPIPAALAVSMRWIAPKIVDRLFGSNVLMPSANRMAADVQHPIAAELNAYLDRLARRP